MCLESTELVPKDDPDGLNSNRHTKKQIARLKYERARLSISGGALLTAVDIEAINLREFVRGVGGRNLHGGLQTDCGERDRKHF
jgi:hypothetical protein